MKILFSGLLLVGESSPTEKEERRSLVDKLQSAVAEREALITIFGDSASSLMEVADCRPCPLSELKLTGSSLAQLGCPPCIVPVAVAAPAVAIGGSVALTVGIVALIAAGIVGGGAVAGIGAGLSGGLMGILMGKSGIFNSHKDRRRKKDEQMPCESYDPLDTNDHDCFVLRWNRMTWYFGAHRNLKRLQRLIVTGEGETEQMMNDMESDFLHLHSRIFGIAGTFFKPSKNHGLLSDVAKFDSVVGFLAENTEKTINQFTFMQEGISKLAESDLNSIKVHGIDALGYFQADSADILSQQQASHAINDAVMTMGATKLLSSAALDVFSGQQESVDALESADHQRRLALSAAIRQVEEQTIGMDVVDGQMEKVKKQMATRETLLSDSMNADLTAVVSKVGDADTKTMTQVKRSLDNVTFPVSDMTKSEIIKNKAIWHQLVRNGVLGMWNQVQSLADYLNAQSMKIFNEIMSLSALNVSQSVDNTNLDLLARIKAHEAMVNSIAQFVSWLIQNSQPDDIKAEKNGFETDLAVELEAIKKQVQDQLKSGGSLSKEAVAAIVAAIASASSDSKAVMRLGESGFVSKVSEIMKMLGVNTFDAGKLYSDIANAVAKSEQKPPVVSEKSTQSVASLLLAALKDLGLSMNELGRNEASKMKGIDSLLLNLTTEGNVEVMNQIRGLATAGLAGYMEKPSFVRQAKRIEATRDAGSQLLNTMFGLTGSKDSLATMLALYQLSNGGTLESITNALIYANDRLTADLSRQVRGFNTSGVGIPAFSQSASHIASMVRDFRKSLDKINQRSSESETRTLVSSQTLEGLLAQLQAQTDSTEEKLSQSSSGLKAEVSKALEAIMTQQGDGLTKYRSQYGSELYEGTLQTVQGFVMATQEQRRLELKRIQDEQTAEAEKLSSAAEAMGKLISGLHAGVENIEADSGIGGSRFRDTRTFNKMVADLFRLSASDLRKLVVRFEMMRSLVGEGFANYSMAIADEVADLPRIITEGVLSDARMMTMQASDLESSILKIRQQLATSHTKSDTRTAKAAIGVLSSLEKLQTSLGSIDRQIREGVGKFTNVSAEVGGKALKGIDILRKALIKVTGDALSLNTTKDFAAFESRINKLWSVTESVVSAALDDSDMIRSEESLKQAVRWNQAEFELKTREALMNTEFENATTVSFKTLNRSTSQAAVIGKLIVEVESDGTEALKSISEASGIVLNQLASSREKIEANVSTLNSDIVTQQAVVRQAMRAFLNLLRELGSSVASRNDIISGKDEELVKQAGIDLKTEIQTSEESLLTTRRNIERFHAILNSTENAQSEYEESIRTDVRSLNGSLQEFNQRRNTLFVNSRNLMNEITATNQLILDGMSHEIDRIFDTQ